MNFQDRRRWLLGGAAAAAAFAGIGFGWWRTGAPPAAHRLATPQAAPAGLWEQRFERPAGGELVMAHLRGKPVLLNFWATWCAPCVAEMPMLDTFQREHAGWQVVGLAVDNPEPVRDFVAQRKIEFAIGLVGFGGADLARDLGNTAGALPYSVVFDRSGTVQYKKLGALKPDDLAHWAKALG
jgi:thiol-disulfide isomerase/thioredoxin